MSGVANSRAAGVVGIGGSSALARPSGTGGLRVMGGSALPERGPRAASGKCDIGGVVVIVVMVVSRSFARLLRLVEFSALGWFDPFTVRLVCWFEGLKGLWNASASVQTPAR
jgi:hypothetical protein